MQSTASIACWHKCICIDDNSSSLFFLCCNPRLLQAIVSYSFFFLSFFVLNNPCMQTDVHECMYTYALLQYKKYQMLRIFKFLQSIQSCERQPTIKAVIFIFMNRLNIFWITWNKGFLYPFLSHQMTTMMSSFNLMLNTQKNTQKHTCTHSHANIHNCICVHKCNCDAYYKILSHCIGRYGSNVEM